MTPGIARALTAALVLAVAAPALAGPPSATPASGGKDPGVATALSVGVTAGSLGLFLAAGSSGSDTGLVLALAGAAGMYVGPSTGHWYAGEVGTAGLVLRGLAAVAVIEGLDMRRPFDCLGSGQGPAPGLALGGRL